MRVWCLGLVVCSSVQAQPFDPARSELVVLVWKRGAASAFAHDHVVRATAFSGTATADGGVLSVQVEVDATSLVADEPALRERLKVGAPVSEDDARHVTSNLKAESQLDVARFPSIRFETLGSTVPAEGGKGVVSGILTLHGVSRQVQVPATATPVDGGLEASARLRFKTSEFGVRPYSAMLGLVGNRDEVELRIRLLVPGR